MEKNNKMLRKPQLDITAKVEPGEDGTSTDTTLKLVIDLRLNV